MGYRFPRFGFVPFPEYRSTEKEKISNCQLDFFWNGRRRQLAGFSLSGSTTVVLERPSPAAGWIFVLRNYNCSTETVIAGGRLDFRPLIAHL